MNDSFKDINIISLRGQIIPIDLGCSQLCLEKFLFPFCNSQQRDEHLANVLRMREAVLGYKFDNCIVSTPYHHYQQDPGNVEDWEMERVQGLEDVDASCEILPSGYSVSVTITMSRQLRLATQELQKSRSEKIPAWLGQMIFRPYLVL